MSLVESIKDTEGEIVSTGLVCGGTAGFICGMEATGDLQIAGILGALGAKTGAIAALGLSRLSQLIINTIGYKNQNKEDQGQMQAQMIEQ